MNTDQVTGFEPEAAVSPQGRPETRAPFMKAIQIAAPGGDWQLVEREIPAIPKPDWVRIKVQACGICHKDQLVKEGQWPGLQYPRIPGHEVAGVIDEVGAGVTVWRKGQRVGVGWYGGHCGLCIPCRRGNFIGCRKGGITGFTHDGGYAEYMVAPAQSLAAIRDGRLGPEDVGPLMCAGVTTFNALRRADAEHGDLVAIQGMGGLGHLGIQFAHKLGYRTVAISRGDGSRELALKLGANVYINSDVKDPAQELQRMGGAKVVLYAEPSGKSAPALMDGLGVEGQMIVVGASPEPIEISPTQLISGLHSIRGWDSGVAIDCEDMLVFSGTAGIRPMVELFPLDEAAQAFERMRSGEAKFRVVLTMNR